MESVLENIFFLKRVSIFYILILKRPSSQLIYSIIENNRSNVDEVRNLFWIGKYYE